MARMSRISPNHKESVDAFMYSPKIANPTSTRPVNISVTIDTERMIDADMKENETMC